MVDLESVKRAQLNIADIIHRTAILSSEQFDLASGNRVYFKAEHLQKTGSFKIRGAANAVKNAVRGGAASITAASSGNHGQAVAYVAKQLGVPAAIVVPETASRVKVAAIESYGAEVVYCGTTSAHRIPKAQQLAVEKNGVYIPPYDHEDIMSGQGTIGLELLEQLDGLDVILVPVGGGGLISGILAAVKNVNPGIQVIGVEPEEANDTWLSLQNGRITSIPESFTIADGLRTAQPGAMTFPVLQQYLDSLLLVSEADIKKTFQFLAERTKQLVEPSSAMAAAPLLFGELKDANLKAAVVLSGGNVDLKELQAILPE